MNRWHRSPDNNQSAANDVKLGNADRKITQKPGRVVSSVHGSRKSEEGQTTEIRSGSQLVSSRTGAKN